jgi:hypothetical protein
MTAVEALLKLAKSGRIKLPWRDGMNVTFDGIGAHRINRWHDDGTLYIQKGWTPDLNDHATKGCLLALVREASGDSTVYCRPSAAGWYTAGYENDTLDNLPETPTEGAALVAALVAMAGEL